MKEQWMPNPVRNLAADYLSSGLSKEALQQEQQRNMLQ
jgi:hypothetical protein